MLKFISLLSIFILPLLANNAVKCLVVNEGDILKIKCKYNTISKDYDRNVSISWTPPTTHHDDRMKTILVPAYNISVYDYRYFDGRAEGLWTISVADEESKAVTTTQFMKEDLSQSDTKIEVSKSFSKTN